MAENTNHFKCESDFEAFLHECSDEKLKNMVINQLCRYINRHSLDPRSYGYWFSRNKIILFSLQQIHERAVILASELDIATSDIKVEISGDKAEIRLNYIFKKNIQQEVHAISNYCRMESSLYDFLNPQ